MNNDRRTAEELAALLAKSLSHVNLIPVNTVEGNGFVRPSEQSVRDFQKVLMKKGIEATIRRELGSDISGACGQLKRSVVGERNV